MARRKHRRERQGDLLGAGLRGVLVSALVVKGGWILYSNMAIDHNVPLPEALPVERRTFQTDAAGTLSYYRGPEAAGRPLVLLHSINAAASAYEMRPLFMHYRGQRPVFALDLPGYGFSERADRAYSPQLFEDAIIEFLATQVAEAADVVALSLSSEFAARAALARPDLFNSLSLISPTGLSLKNGQRGSQQAGESGFSDILFPAFSFPLWRRPFYDLIATRKSIIYFLQQSFMGPVPEDLITYAYATSHQPGAEFVPLHFISGKLFSPGVRQRVYEQVQVPTLVLYDRDAFTGFEMLPELLARNPAWQAVRIVPTLGLPHFERLDETAAVLDRFWQ